MTNTEGLLGVLIIIEVVLGLIGCCVISIAYAILVKIQSRPIRLTVLISGMAVNLVYFIQIDAPMMLTGALALGIPMAVLVPPLCFPKNIVEPAGLVRILHSYAVIWIVGAILPFLFVVSGLSMVPWVFWHTPLSNGLIYVCLMLGNIGLATVVYRGFDKWKGVPE